MKYIIPLVVIFLLCFSSNTKAQDQFLEGEISYKSSQNIYVKFQSTKLIQVGDTLFLSRDNSLVPVLKVNNKSSISVVASPIGDVSLKVGDKLFAKLKDKLSEEKPEPVETDLDYNTEVVRLPSQAQVKKMSNGVKENIYGRLSASSYSNLSSEDISSNHRMRYALSLNAQNIADSKFSTETNIRFSHESGEWDEVKSNLYSALKIYSLALKYEMSESTDIWFGRKTNSKIANIGAVDGVQLEKRFGNFSLGAIAGSRPDYLDYSFDFNQVQFGGYLEHRIKTDGGYMQNTLAFVEQKYHSNTDRRLLYYQHSNALLKNLFLFSSFEVDLFKLKNDSPKSTFDLTSLYLSLRYRVSRKLSLSSSYDIRKNVIYYETFKSLAFQILENETRQGFRFRIHYRPAKNLSLGGNMGYRSRKNDREASKNMYAYVSYRNVPVINSSVTASNTQLRSNYLKGQIYRMRLSRDIIPAKLFASIKYSYVDYNYSFNNNSLLQHVADLNLSWRIHKKLSFSANYEGTFEKSNTYTRLYFNLIKRF